MKLNSNQLFTWILVTVIVSLTVGVSSSVITHRLLVNQWVAQNQQAQVVNQDGLPAETQDLAQSEDQVLAARTTNLPTGTVSAGSGSLVAQIFSQLETRFKQAIVDVDNDEAEASGNSGAFDGYLDTFRDR